MLKIPYSCQECGKIKYAIPSVAKKRKFCSYHCANSGENHPRGMSGKKQKQSSKDKIRKKVSGKNNGMYSQGYLITGHLNPMYGKKHTEEAKEKNRQSHLGKKIADVSNMCGRTGDKHPRWRGDKYKKNNRWYVWINGKRISNARYIAEKCLKRKLTTIEVIHHINKNSLNDAPKNLYVFKNRKEHSRHHGLKNPLTLISNLI